MDDTPGRTFRSIRNRLPIMGSDRSPEGTDPPEGSVSPLMRHAVIRGSEFHSVHSMGVCSLDEYGHRLYNIDDEAEVYISRKSPRAMSNEEDSVLIRATDGNFVGQPDLSADVHDDHYVDPEDVRGLFANILRDPFRVDIHGVVGTVRDGRIFTEPKESRLMEKMARPSLGMRRIEETALPERLYIKGRVDIDATTVSGVAVQTVQRTSTGCGLRIIEDGPPADEGKEREDDGLHRDHRGRSDPRMEAPTRKGRRGWGDEALPDRGGHPSDDPQRRPQVLGDPPSLRGSHGGERGPIGSASSYPIFSGSDRFIPDINVENSLFAPRTSYIICRVKNHNICPRRGNPSRTGFLGRDTQHPLGCTCAPKPETRPPIRFRHRRKDVPSRSPPRGSGRTPGDTGPPSQDPVASMISVSPISFPRSVATVPLRPDRRVT